MPFRAFLLLSLLAVSRCRDCGQAEIDAQDIRGCITVTHMKYLGHKNAIWLGDQLHHNPDLRELDLHHTHIGDDDAVSLSLGLHNNTHLKRLAMHNNQIRDAGAAALGKGLAENEALEWLQLSSNGISDKGAVGLAEGLAKNRGLRRLDMYFNMVGDEGAVALAKALSQNRGLRTLHLDTNSIGEEGGLAFAEALRGVRSSSSSVFSLSYQTTFPALSELTLLYNHLSNKAADALVAAGKVNPHVHNLAIDHNHMLHGASKDAVLTEHSGLMKERKQIAQWLVENDLVERGWHHKDIHGGWHSAEGPPLSSPFAPVVAVLRAHTREGLVALKHEDAASLARREELQILGPEQREILSEKLMHSIELATAHDEL